MGGIASWRSGLRRASAAGAGLCIVAAAAGVSPPAASGEPQGACTAKTPWTTMGFDLARTGFNPCETALSTATVPAMRLRWSATLSGASVVQPSYAPAIVVNGTARALVFIGDEKGNIEALNAGTGAVVWKRNIGSYHSTCQDMPNGDFGVSGAPVLDLATNTGYVMGGLGSLYAIDLSTGASRAGWPIALVDPTVDHVYGSLTLHSGVVYVTTASYCDQNSYLGKVIAVSTSTAQVSETWNVADPTANPGATGGGIWGPGGVSIDTANGAVYAATGNTGPLAENVGYGEQVVRLDSTLHVQAANYTPLAGGDVDYGATPVLFQPPSCPPMLAAENKSGVLVVYDRDNIAGGPVQKIQVAGQSAGAFIGDPAWSPADNMLYVANTSTTDNGTFLPGLIAFAVQPDCTLGVAWTQSFGFSGSPTTPPIVANGVVYEGDGFDHTLWAFDSHTGTHLWDSGTTIADTMFGAPTVADGMVYVATWDGHVEAFGLSEQPDAPTGVTAAAGIAKISVSYTAPANPGASAITGYRATCVSSDGGVTKSSAYSLTVPLVVSSLSAGHTYTCTVVAKNATGVGPASTASNAVVIPRAPDAPTGVTATSGIGRITVSYTPPASNGGSAITGYRATCVSSDGGVTKSSPYTLVVPLVAKALSAGHTYTCTVVAKNAAGVSPASAASNVVVIPRAPDAPTGIVATGGIAKITVSYTPPVNNGGAPITGYRATCASNDGGVTKTSALGTANPIVLTGASSGHHYTCTVVAKNGAGTGPASVPSNAVLVQ